MSILTMSTCIMYMTQERHLVYEYWVSTEEEDASTHLERETAELIETLVCSNKQ